LALKEIPSIMDVKWIGVRKVFKMLIRHFNILAIYRIDCFLAEKIRLPPISSMPKEIPMLN
jgi:hypothetical protein